MKRETQERLRQIVAAIDASPMSVAALEVAARLAVRTGATLTAVYVEDVNLLRAASYPQAFAYSLITARQRPLEGAVIEQAFRLQAAAARRALEEAAASLGISAALQTRRGPVVREMLAAAAEADLLVMGWSGRPGAESPARRTLRLGSTARAVLREAVRPVLLWRPGMRPEGGVVAVLEPGLAGEATLALAARLVPEEAPLDVIAVAEGGAAADLEAAALQAVTAHPGGGRVATVPPQRPGRLVQALAARPQRLVVVSQRLREMLESAHCALAVVPD